MQVINNLLLKLIKRCELWFWLFTVALFVKWERAGLLILQKSPDSLSYNLSQFGLESGDGLRTALTNLRTLGYPLLLKIVSTFSPDLQLLPEVQFIMFACAIFLLFFGLRSYGFSGWQALFGSWPLLLTINFQEHVGQQLTETAAESMAVAAIAFLLMIVSKPAGLARWAGLIISLFLTYQIRPAFLFMIPALPLIGLFLHVIKHERWQANLKPLAVKLLLACFLPFFAFSVVRSQLVGHFGVVSFEGFNIAGLATNMDMLTEDVVADLPADQQPLANAILAARKQKLAKMTPAEQASQLVSGVFLKDCAQSNETGQLRIEHWVYCFNYSVWQVAVPTSFGLYGKDLKLINDKLRDLSLAIIKARPALYVKWVLKAFWTAHFATVQWETPTWRYFAPLLILSLLFNLALIILDKKVDGAAKFVLAGRNRYYLAVALMATLPFLYLLKRVLVSHLDNLLLLIISLSKIFALLLSLAALVFLFERLSGKRLLLTRYDTQLFSREIAAVAIICLVFFSSGVSLVVLVEPPIPRYVQAVSIFLPSLFSVTLFASLAIAWQKILSMRRAVQLFSVAR